MRVKKRIYAGILFFRAFKNVSEQGVTQCVNIHRNLKVLILKRRDLESIGYNPPN